MRRAIPLLLLSSCTVPFSPADDAAIRHIMAMQEAAWDQGDIPGFMAGYADTVCFVSRKGTTCGRDAVTANYQRSYPDKAAMGDLEFGIQELVPAGDGHAWLTGTWAVYRAEDTLDGGFTLLWVRGADGWLIARDHTY